MRFRGSDKGRGEAELRQSGILYSYELRAISYELLPCRYRRLLRGGPEGAAEDEVEGGFVLGVVGLGEEAGEAVGFDGEELVFEGLEECGLARRARDGCGGQGGGGGVGRVRGG
jgi:hypothetical protein